MQVNPGHWERVDPLRGHQGGKYRPSHAHVRGQASNRRGLNRLSYLGHEVDAPRARWRKDHLDIVTLGKWKRSNIASYHCCKKQRLTRAIEPLNKRKLVLFVSVPNERARLVLVKPRWSKHKPGDAYSSICQHHLGICSRPVRNRHANLDLARSHIDVFYNTSARIKGNRRDAHPVCHWIQSSSIVLLSRAP